MADEIVQTVRMWRPVEEARGGPIVADVHPAEVENYRYGGWLTGDHPSADEAPEADEPDTADAPAKRGRKPKA